MLSRRILILNPSAVKKSVVKLNNYRLTFAGPHTEVLSSRWQGYAATIVPDMNSHVWGVLWELQACDQTSLDKQEGVPDWYRRIEVKVSFPDGEREIEAVSYEQVDYEGDRIPSAVYHHVILSGAKEHNVPADYLNRLRGIENNGNTGDPAICPIDWDSVKDV